jgi:hypothetical protein
VLHQCLTTGLRTSVGSELGLYGLQFLIYVIDHCQRELHYLPGCLRKLQPLQMGASFHRVQLLLLGIAVMEDLGVDALLMSRTLLDEAMPEPHQCPDLLDVIWCYPRLRQPFDHHKVPQMCCIQAIGLGPLLAALKRSGLRLLGQVCLDTGSAKFLDHVAPTGGCPYGESDLLAGELLGELIEPPSQALASGRADLATM